MSAPEFFNDKAISKLKTCACFIEYYLVQQYIYCILMKTILCSIAYYKDRAYVNIGAREVACVKVSPKSIAATKNV